MPALFLIFNESQLDPELLENLGSTGGQSLDRVIEAMKSQSPSSASAGAPPNAAIDPATLKEGGERHTINGYIYGNLPGLDMNEGERVRWYLFGLGSESDFHTPHWHGLRVIEDGKRQTDTVELMPASMKVADMVADNPGDWLFHCHVVDHMANGMFALLTVHPKDKPATSRTLEPPFLGLPTPPNREAQTKTAGAMSN
jgi:FtsP/CotA-like multicopper oxidase with cupredoxin domain